MDLLTWNVIVSDEKALSECDTFITGFHGLGEIGYIATKHLSEKLNGCKRSAVIYSSGAPPFISIQDKQLKLPFEIYTWENLAIFLVNIQPYRHVQVEFTEKLGKWILENEQFKEGYFIGGVDDRLKSEGGTQVRYVPTTGFIKKYDTENPSLCEEVLKNTLEPGLFIAGPLAVLLGYLEIHKFPSLGILSYAARDRPDPAGAAIAIKELSKLLGKDLPVEPLIENARLIEEEIQQRLLESSGMVEEDDDDRPARMYS